MSPKITKVLIIVIALCIDASSAGAPSSCEFYREYFNGTLESFMADIESAFNKTVRSMTLYAQQNADLSQVKYNKGLRDTQSAGSKAISDIFSTFEDVVGGLTGVSHAYLEAVFFEDEPNDRFPLSCIDKIYDAKIELQSTYTQLGGLFSALAKE